MKSNKKPNFTNSLLVNYYKNYNQKYELIKISFTYEIESGNPAIRVKNLIKDLPDDVDGFVKDCINTFTGESFILEFTKKYSELKESGKFLEEAMFDEVHCFLSDISKSFNRIGTNDLLSVVVEENKSCIMNEKENQSNHYKEIEALLDKKIGYFLEEMNKMKVELLSKIKE